jgi:hypothetical protein
MIPSSLREHARLAHEGAIRQAAQTWTSLSQHGREGSAEFIGGRLDVTASKATRGSSCDDHLALRMIGRLTALCRSIGVPFSLMGLARSDN